MYLLSICLFVCFSNCKNQKSDNIKVVRRAEEIKLKIIPEKIDSFEIKINRENYLFEQSVYYWSKSHDMCDEGNLDWKNGYSKKANKEWDSAKNLWIKFELYSDSLKKL